MSTIDRETFIQQWLINWPEATLDDAEDQYEQELANAPSPLEQAMRETQEVIDAHREDVRLGLTPVKLDLNIYPADEEETELCIHLYEYIEGPGIIRQVYGTTVVVTQEWRDKVRADINDDHWWSADNLATDFLNTGVAKDLPLTVAPILEELAGAARAFVLHGMIHPSAHEYNVSMNFTTNGV